MSCYNRGWWKSRSPESAADDERDLEPLRVNAGASRQLNESFAVVEDGPAGCKYYDLGGVLLVQNRYEVIRFLVKQ